MRPLSAARTAHADDAEAVRQLVKAAYKPYVERMGRDPAPMVDDYDLLIAKGLVHVTGFEGNVEGNVDGFVIAGVIVMWASDDHWYVDNVATSPEFRGVGVGRALLDAADAAAAQAGFDEVRLYTNVAMTENLDYYPRIGFTETHRGTDAGYERVYFTRPVGRTQELPGG